MTDVSLVHKLEIPVKFFKSNKRFFFLLKHPNESERAVARMNLVEYEDFLVFADCLCNALNEYNRTPSRSNNPFFNKKVRPLMPERIKEVVASD